MTIIVITVIPFGEVMFGCYWLGSAVYFMNIKECIQETV